MAVTWIGVIKGSGISRSINYVANPDKTTEDAFYSVNMEQSIEYAINPSKDVQRLYRTAINCSSVENACSEMMDTKQRFGKTEGGALGFHVVQSFKPGEIAPELAHRLGCELARRCFGNYEAIVGTHLDKAHIHNHIIVNSVSFVDGRKYHSHAGSYYHEIRKTSDALCREYGLSIVQDNGQSRGKIPYAQRKAEQAGKPTWDSALRSDIDYAISQSRSFEQWVYNLRNMGYAVKTNVKHLAVLPPGKQKFIRLRRLGEDYSEEGIRSRIKGNTRKKLPPPEREQENPTAREYRPNVRRVRYRGSFPKCKRSRITGFMALYLWYAYRMGNKGKARPNNRRMHYLLREDIHKMDRRMAICSMLQRHHIRTEDDLNRHETEINACIGERIAFRKKLYKRQNRAANQSEIDRLSEEIKALRRELKLIEHVRTDGPALQEKRNRILRDMNRSMERRPRIQYREETR
ncbi:MAG: relaxase/mobilization nuclease domain-containing protein [Clostridia bacterium]|nr:relaxase/mobilization nuclease domain-containing protein [Clostridia bacterium]